MPHLTCETCGCRLSRYTIDGARCAAHGGDTYATYESFLDAPAQMETERRYGPGMCIRGHDLEQHGVMVDRGGGTKSRRCGKCRSIRAQNWTRERRVLAAAKLAAAA